MGGRSVAQSVSRSLSPSVVRSRATLEPATGGSPPITNHQRPITRSQLQRQDVPVHIAVALHVDLHADDPRFQARRLVVEEQLVALLKAILARKRRQQASFLRRERVGFVDLRSSRCPRWMHEPRRCVRHRRAAVRQS